MLLFFNPLQKQMARILSSLFLHSTTALMLLANFQLLLSLQLARYRAVFLELLLSVQWDPASTKRCCWLSWALPGDWRGNMSLLSSSLTQAEMSFKWEICRQLSFPVCMVVIFPVVFSYACPYQTKDLLSLLLKSVGILPSIPAVAGSGPKC